MDIPAALLAILTLYQTVKREEWEWEWESSVI
mgnify:CR=1 FL=1